MERMFEIRIRELRMEETREREIIEELSEIDNIIIKNIRLTIEGKEGYQKKIVKSDEINRRRRKVNLKIYDNRIIVRGEYCGMKGA